MLLEVFWARLVHALGLVTVMFVELSCNDGVSIGNLRIMEKVKVNFLVESVV